MSSIVDKLFPIRADGPVLKSKWMQDWEKSWEKPETPDGRTPRCELFKTDWKRCADGLTFERARAECRMELEDMMECISCVKQKERTRAILKQRDKLIKEGKYTPPPFPESF